MPKRRARNEKPAVRSVIAQSQYDERVGESPKVSLLVMSLENENGAVCLSDKMFEAGQFPMFRMKIYFIIAVVAEHRRARL